MVREEERMREERERRRGDRVRGRSFLQPEKKEHF